MRKFFIYFIIIVNIFSNTKNIIYFSQWKVDENFELKLINSNKEYKDKSLKDLNSHNFLWEIITKLYPKEILYKIKNFNIFIDNRNEDNQFLAFIEAIPNSNNQYFSINIDISDFYKNNSFLKEKYIDTLIHEFFHIISLNESQISQENTGYLRIYEGYCKKESYLNQFYEKFWEIFSKRNSNFIFKYSELSYDEKIKIYTKYENQFFNYYALTNPIEDIAVSFEYFVKLGKENHFKNIKRDKIEFFYNYPELIKYKNYLTEKKNRLIIN